MKKKTTIGLAKIMVEYKLGWATGQMKWFATAYHPDGTIGQKRVFDTKRRATAQVLMWCAEVLRFGDCAGFVTNADLDIWSLGNSPKEASQSKGVKDGEV